MAESFPDATKITVMVSKTKLRGAGASHPGLVRSNNEDRFHFDPDRGIFLVIDGIGGHAAGEKAADVALNMIRSRLERETGTAAERIREAIAVANNEIFRLARMNPEWTGMACVLTVTVVEDGSAVIGHVGDSRLYKIRGGHIQKVTHDHSPVGEREDSNDLSETDAMRHPRRNEVYRDVGTEEHTPDDPNFIELIHISFEDDSALLLCSDGLSDQVTSPEILRTVERGAQNPDDAVRELIAAANHAGGKDNVSVVIAEGPLFTSQPRAATLAEQDTESAFTGRAAFAIYGFIAGLLFLAALQLRFGWLNPVRVSPSPSAARVLVVGTSAGAQFSTINDALSQARFGDTVELLGGEYREQIRLPDGVSLTSRVPHAAIIRAAPAEAGPPVAIMAENIKNGRITGLRVLADEKLPLSIGILLENSNIEIADSEIAGAVTGIEIRGDSHPALRANSVHDSVKSGIVISGPAAPWLSHNEILRNGRAPRELRPGVLVSSPAQPVFIGNVFSDNGAQAVVLPAGMDSAPILKFNFFLKGEPLGRTQPEALHGVPKQHRRRP
jgi:serine/threonine protein phosphatase PrpC